MDLQDRRRASLRLLIKQWGGPTTLAKKLQHKGPSYLSQLVSGNRPITEKTARGVEDKLGLPGGWMDQDPTERTGQQPRLDTALLSRVLPLVDETLREVRAVPTTDQRSEIIALVYEDAQAKGGIDEGFLRRIVKLMTKE